jgi:hypothetical protein
LKKLQMSVAIFAALSSVESASIAQKTPEVWEIGSYKFWIHESGDSVCLLGSKFFIERLYNRLKQHQSPAFEYHIDGRPQGPAFIVEIEGMSLSPEKCYWRIQSDIVSYDLPGWEPKHRLTEYYNLGPSRSFGDVQRNDVVEKIEGQLDYFVQQRALRKQF